MLAPEPVASNFAFLEPYEPRLAHLGFLAERLFAEDPGSALTRLRLFGEILAQQVGARHGVYRSPQENQADLLARLRGLGLDRQVLELFHGLRQAGNAAAHEMVGDRELALRQVRMARALGQWYVRLVADRTFEAPAFVPPPDPRQASEALKVELARLREELVALRAESRDQQERARTEASRYGTARYGHGQYGDPVLPTTVWSVPPGGYDARNQLTRFLDADQNETVMTYDGEGRRKTITYPNGVTTLAEYDFLGRLLSLTTNNGTETILDLQYAYDRNSNRRAMRCNGDRFDYRLDAGDRLVQETLNCWSRREAEDFRLGSGRGVDTVGDPGKVQVLGFSDSLSGGALNADRWRVAVTNQPVRSLDVRPDDGLAFTFPRGFANRMFAHPPDYDNDATPLSWADTYGLSTSPFWACAEHLLTLEGDFVVTVDLERLQKVLDTNEAGRQVRVGLLVRDARVEAEADFSVGIFRAEDATHDGWLSELRVAGVDATPAWNTNYATPSGRLRLSVANAAVTTSFQEANGSVWKDLHTQHAFDPQAPLHVSLFLEVTSALATVTFRDFLKTGDEYPFQTASNAAGFTSEVFDAGRPGARLDRISWWEDRPTMACDVEFQVAARDLEPGGDWESDFRGPDGTSASWFTTPAGEDLDESVVGRYFRYRARLVSDGTSTPAFTDLRVTMAGDNPWYDRRYTFDERGNMVGRTVLDATGQVVETRTANELNQIETNAIDDGTTVTTWTYTWDPNGNLQSKSRPGEAWTYDFDKDNRLVRVQKVVSGTLQLDVSYTYDSVGRMLTRKLSTDTNPTTFEWDGWDLLREVDPDGTETLYYAPQGEILSFKRGDSVYQVHADALASVRNVSDVNGATAVEFDFDNWGNVLTSAVSTVGNVSVRFIGAHGVRSDETIGLILMRRRWYDPSIGRFLSRDPISREVNPYSYALNQPTDRVDPTGLASIIVINYDPRFSHVDWRKIRSKIQSQTGFTVLVRSGLDPNPGFQEDSETYSVNIRYNPKLIIDQRTGKPQVGATPPLGLPGSPAGAECGISPSGVLRSVLLSEWAAQNDILKAPVLKEHARNFLLNSILHELGHALSGSGHELLRSGPNPSLMDVKSQATQPKEWMTTVLDYDSGRIKQIVRYVGTGETW